MTTDPVAHPPRTLLALLRLGLPLAFIQLGAASLGLIDTAVMGRTTPAELAAVGLGNSITFAISVLGMGLVQGAEPLMAQAVGAGDAARARRVLRQGIWVALLAWLPILFATLLFLLALPLFHVSAEVVPLTRDYVLARSIGLLPFLLYWAAKGWLQAHGRTRAPVIGIGIALVLEALLAVLLVFGSPALHLPALGVVGAGIAHTATSVVRLAVVAVAAGRGSGGAGRWGRMREAWAPTELWRMVRIGLPLGLQLALEVGVFAFAALTMGRLGSEALAAHQVAIQVASVTFNVMVGLGSACAVLVGQRIGARDSEGARRVGVVALWMSVVSMAFTGAVFLTSGAPLARLLTNDDAVVQRAVALLTVAAAFQLSDGLQVVASGALRGAGDTRVSFIIHLLSHWGVGMPCVLGFVALGFGGPGVWWGLTLGLTVAAALLVVRFLRQARRGLVALV